MDTRQKLLQAHYAGAVPQDLLASEMQRLTRALAEVEGEIAAAKATTSEVDATLTAALAAAGNCQRAYQAVPSAVRRQINQGLFEKLLIGADGTVERAELTEPFAALLANDDTVMLTSAAAKLSTKDAGSASQTAAGAAVSAQATADAGGRVRLSDVLRRMVTESEQKTAPGQFSLVRGGLNEQYVVGLTRQHTNRTILVEGPEITIRPVGTRRLSAGGAR
jgi:site-specific DNA recombinase